MAGKDKDVKVQGACKKGDGFRTKRASAKEANEEAMKHSGDKHGDRFLGFKWS